MLVKTCIVEFTVDNAEEELAKLDRRINGTRKADLKGEIVSIQDNVVPISEGSLTTTTRFMLVRTLSIKKSSQ